MAAKIKITFRSVNDEYLRQFPNGGEKPYLRVERFHQLVEQGAFGPVVNVTYKVIPGKEASSQTIGLEYCVQADAVDSNRLLAGLQQDDPPK